MRLREKLRPGRIEPVDLTLDPDYHPDRDLLNVGADLRWLAPRPSRQPCGPNPRVGPALLAAAAFPDGTLFAQLSTERAI